MICKQKASWKERPNDENKRRKKKHDRAAGQDHAED